MKESSMQKGVLALAAVAAFWTLPALAQTVTIPQDVFLTTQGEGQYLAKDLLLGAKVHNAEGQIIGDIEDLILNADNQVQGVVMGVGGFAGFGEKRVGISLAALQIKNDNGIVTVSLPQATKEVLDALAPFERKQPAKSLVDRAIEKAKELSDKGSVTAKEAYDKAKPALEKAYEDVKTQAGPALEKAQEATKDAYETAKKALEKPAETPAPATEATPPATTTPPAEKAPETPPATTPPPAAP
jgi:sporulation protein YlmC with PRC-barrel domain